MTGHSLEQIQKSNETMTEEQKQAFTNWVRKEKGTLEYCMPIGKKGEGTAFDSNDDWDVGVPTEKKAEETTQELDDSFWEQSSMESE